MNRRAAALLPVVGVVTVVAIPVAWSFFAPKAPRIAPIVAAALPLVPDGEASANAEVALLRAGVSPKALAAVGVVAFGAASVADAGTTHYASNHAALTAADAAYANAKRESDRLRRLIESGKGTQEDVASYQTQLAAFATATTQQQAALGALFEAATASLSAGQRSAMQRIDAAKGWGLPAEFSVVERSEAAWVELRGALANERFAAKYHEEPDQAAVAFLANARADQAVAAAATGIATNEALVAAAWRTALAD